MKEVIQEYVANHSDQEVIKWIADTCKRINGRVSDDLKDKNFELLCYSLNDLSLVSMMANALVEKNRVGSDPAVVA